MEQIGGALLGAQLHEAPKIAEYHPAHDLLAPFQVKKVAHKQRFMSGGGDRAYKQFILSKASEIGALRHGNHSVFSTQTSPRVFWHIFVLFFRRLEQCRNYLVLLQRTQIMLRRVPV
jgi:hypothetical protein